MKKSMLFFVLLGLMPALSAGAYEYRKESSQYASARSANKKSGSVRKTGGYHNTINNNFYYTQPARQSNRAQMYRDYDVEYASYETVVEKDDSVVQTKAERSSQERKYFLAHPFFQPLQSRFGSVTDISYAANSMDFRLIDGTFYDWDEPVPGYAPSVSTLWDLKGESSIKQFLVKEDVSLGLSDTLALVLMAQYDSTKVKFDNWSDGSLGSSSSNSGVNVFGIGLQNRFIDNAEWIAMFSGFFQHQKNTANSFMFDVKGGYKIDRTTIYGLARLGYSNLTNGDAYGARVDEDSGDYMVLTYKTNVNDIVNVEAGAGIFSVLNKTVYLGGEMVYGHYDWHNQLNIKGTIGFQPYDSFALSLYASTSLYDSAKAKTNRFIIYDVNPAPILDEYNNVLTNPDSKLGYTVGNYDINKYNEWKIGVQLIAYF